MINDRPVPNPPEDALPVAVDAMGGDYGPGVLVHGAVLAARNLGVSCILVGREDLISEHLERLGASDEALIHIEHAEQEITMEDLPSAAIRSKTQSSIRIAFELVKQGRASGVVSAGNTGAMMAAGLFVVGALPGVARPAIASLLPRDGTDTPTVLLDSGANIDCHANQLVQFALMGNHYARKVIQCELPRVGLLSNGSESSKGNDITRATAQILDGCPEVNFIGYVEGRDISKDVADVVVCDGFIGNVVLKTMEGSVELVLNAIKGCADTNLMARLGLWLARPAFRRLFDVKFDPSSYGGAPLLGLQKTAIVCHGSSNEKAIENAIRVAYLFEHERLIDMLGQALGSFSISELGGYEDGMWSRVGQRLEKKGKKAARVSATTHEGSEK